MGSSSVLTILGVVAVGVLVNALATRFVAGPLARRRARTMAADALVQCVLRLVDGAVEGLDRRWRHGTAELSAGRVTFRRALMGTVGERPGSPTVTLAVLAAGSIRRARGREIWSVNPDCDVVTLAVDGGTVEWAVVRSSRAWAVERVLPGAGPHGEAGSGSGPG